ncbi:MAG: hypothetical protein ACTHMP_21075 [Thermomicrobiales bacterium]
MFVVRYVYRSDRQPSPPPATGATASLLLRSREAPATLVRFDTFTAARAARAATGVGYQLLCEVKGAWSTEPGYAVFAEWQVADAAHTRAFEESRRQLFEVRRQHLVTFAYDWLLQRLDQAGAYLVLGLYGDEAGASWLCREHPAIQRFTQAHPASRYAATDLSGLRVFRVEERASS